MLLDDGAEHSKVGRNGTAAIQYLTDPSGDGHGAAGAVDKGVQCHAFAEELRAGSIIDGELKAYGSLADFGNPHENADEVVIACRRAV